jgi:hypothetical protein
MASRVEEHQVASPPALAADIKGCVWKPRSQKYRFQITLLRKSWTIGDYKPAAVEVGARRYDALQLLLHGPYANTNFPWSSYTQLDIAAAVQLLRARGVDVLLAVAASTRKGWNGRFELRGTSWRAHLPVQLPGRITITISWCGLSDTGEAALHLDRGALAVKGLGCTTTLPASAHSKQDLEETGKYVISKGVDAALVKQNLEAVEQVRAAFMCALSSDDLACRICFRCGTCHHQCSVLLTEAGPAAAVFNAVQLVRHAVCLSPASSLFFCKST